MDEYKLTVSNRSFERYIPTFDTLEVSSVHFLLNLLVHLELLSAQRCTSLADSIRSDDVYQTGGL